jgi:hypothetical protein
MGVEGTKISLTQDPEALALDGALDEEGEALDLEEERLLARAAGEVGFGGGFWWRLLVAAFGPAGRAPRGLNCLAPCMFEGECLVRTLA